MESQMFIAGAKAYVKKEIFVAEDGKEIEYYPIAIIVRDMEVIVGKIKKDMYTLLLVTGILTPSK